MSLAGRPIFELTGLSSQAAQTARPNSKTLVLIRECESSSVDIASPCAKLLVEGCAGCTIRLRSPVSSQTVELVNCTNCTVTSDHPLGTLSADGSESIAFNLAFLTPEVCCYTSRSAGVSVNGMRVPAGADAVVAEPVAMALQYISRTNERGQLATAKVVREGGAGHATTEAALAAAKAKDRMLEHSFAAYLEQQCFGSLRERALDGIEEECPSPQVHAPEC